MPQGLNLARLVNITVNLSPTAAPRNSFGILLIAGDSNVINGLERIRSYTALSAVASDFGTTAPEYLAAQLYFGQSPAPQILNIGRWLRTATSGYINGNVLTSAQQSLTNFTGISNGSFNVTIDGTVKTVTGVNLTAATSLNNIAALITTAIGAAAIMTYNGSQFVLTSNSTGATSSVTVLSPAGTGSDLSAPLAMTTGTIIPGYAAETPVQAATALANFSNTWYGLTFAASTMPTDDQAVAVAGFIEGTSSGRTRIYGITTTNPNAYDNTVTTDIASRLQALTYKRSVAQYSLNQYAICSLIARAFSVDFTANRSTITVMYKVEPGITAEFLTDTQATTLKNKNCNVFVNYATGSSNTAIIEYGTMSNGDSFDERHGLDWFSDYLQNSLFNVLYTSTTKIPQTDAGQNQLVTAAAQACNAALFNGLIGAGTWTAAPVGNVQTGEFLPRGFDIYTPPISQQDSVSRAQRIGQTITIAFKFAGAIQQINGIVNVNR